MKRLIQQGMHLLWLSMLLMADRPAYAHKPSNSYLILDVDGRQVNGQWDIALRDLDMAIGLDQDGNGGLTWNEVRACQDAVAAYALSRLKLASAGATCPIKVSGLLLDEHSDGTYAVLRLHAECAVAVTTLDIDYALLLDIDPQHKGLVQLRHGGQVSTAIFDPDRARQTLRLEDASSLHQFGDHVRNGVWHIWVGYDHILFLLSLLLPAVPVYHDGRWQSRPTFRAAA